MAIPCSIVFCILSLVTRSLAMMTSSPAAVLPAPFSEYRHLLNNQDFSAIFQNTTYSNRRRPRLTKIQKNTAEAPIKIQHPESRKRYNNYKDHYYQPKNVMACIPKVERLCKNVYRTVKVVRDVQRCFDVSFDAKPNKCKLIQLIVSKNQMLLT